MNTKNVEKTDLEDYLANVKEQAKQHIDVLKNEKRSWLEKVLRRLPVFKTFFVKQDALVFYTIQLANLTYSLATTANTQQDHINLIAKVLLETKGADSLTRVDVKKKPQDSKPN